MDHFYFNIPGWFNFHDVYDRAVALLGRDGAHFVEVGCWEGRSAAYMGVGIANSGRKIRFDCVDTWKGSAEHVDKDETRRIFGKFRANMRTFRDSVDIRIVKKESTVAAFDYNDESLDFVFLDASHDKESVSADIRAWLPKVKKDGVLAGDDVAWAGVRDALREIGLGDDQTPLVMSAGAYRSWMLVPDGMKDCWITRVPSVTDRASGGVLRSVVTCP